MSATKLTKPVVREVRSPTKGALIVTMEPSGLVIREKGRRTAYGPLSWGALYALGARISAEEQRAQRRPRARRGRLAVGI